MLCHSSTLAQPHTTYCAAHNTFDSDSNDFLVTPHGFHRNDTHVHELIWSDYDQVRGGLNHIAIFENDGNPTKILHGTRCKMYIANELNDYAMA
eukprot:COSAG02_NODE_602_length_19711_cov_20.882674_5_plen_94_part_00